MLDIKKLLKCASVNIGEILDKVDPDQIEAMAQELAKANRVFTAGWGRAGNVIRILGMDMSQIGKVVFCVGDNNCPSIHPGDVLIINSGSGNTKTISAICAQAKEQGARTCLISGNNPENSVMGKIVDVNVVVPKLDKDPHKFQTGANLKNKGLGERQDWGLNAEQREQMAYDSVTGFYESAFALNEVIKKRVMEIIGAKEEDTTYYHNNLE